MPMIDGASSYVTNITAVFLSALQPPFVLLESIRLAVTTWDRSQRTSIRLECINLFEKIEVALITTLEGLISLFATEDLTGTLTLPYKSGAQCGVCKTYFSKTRVLCGSKGVPVLVLG